MGEFSFIFLIILGLIVLVVPNQTLSRNDRGTADVLRRKRDNVIDDAKILALGAIGTFMDVAQEGVHAENKKSVDFLGVKAETGQKFDVGKSSSSYDADSEEKRRRRSIQRVRRSPCKHSKSTTSAPSNGDEETNAKLKRRNKRKALYDDDDNNNQNENDNEKEIKEESQNIIKSVGNMFRKVFNNILDWFKEKTNGAVENIK